MKLNITETCVSFVCWTTTAALTIYFIYLYSLNADLCIVDYKKFYDTKDDLLPTLSLCLKNPFLKHKLSEHHPLINDTSYLDFLKRETFHPIFMSVDHKNVTVNLSDNVASYQVGYRNGTWKQHYKNQENGAWNIFKFSFSGFWVDRFFNCYDLQVPKDKHVRYFITSISTSIFPDGIRPQEDYGMMTLLHYPNQVLKSGKTMKYSFPERRKDHFIMRYFVTGVEVVRRRDKGDRPCNEDWENYDNSVLSNHVTQIGCRTPYQYPNSSSTVPICNSTEEMEKAQLNLRLDDYGVPPPCRAMEKLYYTYEEESHNSSHMPGKDHFLVGLFVYDEQFKEIVHSRYVVIHFLQNFITNIFYCYVKCNN